MERLRKPKALPRTCGSFLLVGGLLFAATGVPLAHQAGETQQVEPVRRAPARQKVRALRQTLPEEKVAQPNAEIDQYLRSQMKKQRLVGLGVGVVKNGQIRYLKGYGWQDREARIPVKSRKTMFRWASISKTMTAIVAMKLALAGKLNLDTVVSSYVKEYKPPKAYLEKCSNPNSKKSYQGKEIPCQDGFYEIPLELKDRYLTPRMLLGHLSGIMHYSNGKGNPVPAPGLTNDPNHNKGFIWALDYFIDKPLVNKPRQKMSYTTFGFNLAGAVVERAGAQPFHSQVAATIAQPLGMSTLQPDYEWQNIPNRAIGYEKQEPPEHSNTSSQLASATIVRQGSSDVSWKLPGGGFISTVEHLARYCGGLMGEKVLSQSAFETMWTSQKTSSGGLTGVGLSFFIGSRNGHRTITHGGSQRKAKTYLNLAPEDGRCVVVMSNSTYADVKKIAQEVEDIVRTQALKTTLKN